MMISESKASVAFDEDTFTNDQASTVNQTKIITGGAYQASPNSKFETYHLRVKAEQDDRADEIKLCSFKRPHMRAFHFAWWCYHVAFLMWCVFTVYLFYIFAFAFIGLEYVTSVICVKECLAY
eukprot:4688711-Ditylum_brightwellii.AAC.1